MSYGKLVNPSEFDRGGTERNACPFHRQRARAKVRMLTNGTAQRNLKIDPQLIRVLGD